MGKATVLTEKIISDAILSVLAENRKVLKVGNSQPTPSLPAEPAPEQMMPPADAMPPMDMPAGGEVPPMAPEQPNQFDTNFDAGVEADEESDPQHFIQQLTGKLSQSLNSFAEENGADEGLNKYVASMIIAATCKNLGDKAKKELIDKIKSSKSEEEGLGDENLEEPAPAEGAEPAPIQERVLTRKELQELAFGTVGEREPSTPKIKSGKKSVFSGKSF